jgi:hypothetical protein
MNQERDSPFETIESAQEFVNLLLDAIDDAKASILDDIASAQTTKGAERHLEALFLAAHKLTRLRENVLASTRLLNDLRTLRRLLLGERTKRN